jgi:hypothetical protein
MGDKVANETTHHPKCFTHALMLTELEHSDRNSEEVKEEVPHVHAFLPFL